MKTPPMLLGASLLAWGWQTELLILALGLAVALESARWLHWRWQLDATDVNRVVDLCALAFVGLAIYVAIAHPVAEAIFAGLRWMPAILFPLVAVQAYSNFDRLPLTALSMQQRRWGHNERTVDVGYPYFLLCLLAASTGHRTPGFFYLALCALWLWALWPYRNPRYAPAVWLGFLLAAGGVGYAGYTGLVQAQWYLEGRIPEWVLSWFEREVDPYRRITAMGAIGPLKLSSRIVLRVAAMEDQAAPTLLRTASYNVLNDRHWIARTGAFSAIERQPERGWWMRPPARPSASARIALTVRGGGAMLPLPLGAYAVSDLVVGDVERNPMGAVKVREAPDLLIYSVAYAGASETEPPNWPDDYDVPSDYRTSLGAIAAELKLDQIPTGDVPAVLEAFFNQRFAYALDLRTQDGSLPPLLDFLANTRAGHCEYFASATVLLLRQAGIAARYASGYSVQEYSPLEGQFLVRQRHAHAWAIAYIDGHWRNVDTTPSVWVEADAREAPAWTGLYDALSWLWLKLQEWRLSDTDDTRRDAWAWLLVPLVALLLWRLRRRWNPLRRAPAQLPAHAPDGPGADSECYRIVDWYLRRGIAREPGETLNGWFARASLIERDDARSELLAEIVRLHYRYRFDPLGISGEARGRLRELVRAWFENKPA